MKKRVLRVKLAKERGEIKEVIMEEPITIENKQKEKKTASKKKTTKKEKKDA